MGAVVFTDPMGSQVFVTVPTKKQCCHLETASMSLLKSLCLITACRSWHTAVDAGSSAKGDRKLDLTAI